MASPLKYFQIRNGSRILHHTTINITNVSRLGSSSNPVSAFTEEFRNAKPISEMPGLNTYSAIKDFLLAKLTNTKSPVETTRNGVSRSSVKLQFCDLRNTIAELQQKYGEMPTIGTVAINKRLACLNSNLPSDSVQVKLINSVNTVFEIIVHPRIVEVEKELERKIKEGDESDHDLSLLETLLRTDGLTRKDVITFMLDLFMGGIDTTSHSLAFSLYLLERNKDKQKKLQEELDLHKF
ncbi:putative cytochrome P450 49a1 [Armadillidium vulgare]|nr:putative cytochrome P450 49a1 [Armadillidium vulgare]